MTNKRRRLFSIVFIAAIVVLGVVGQIKALYSIPSHVRLLPGQNHELNVGLPFTLSSLSTSPIFTREGNTVNIRSNGKGTFNLQLSLLGLVPLRSVVVDVVEERTVIPGGEAIGVLLAPGGLLVTKVVPVEGVDGRVYSPTRDAGIDSGDVLLSINGQAIHSAEQVSTMLDRAGRSNRSVSVTVKRKGKVLRMNLSPVRVGDSRSGYRYMMGAVLEMPTAGIGTLTFYDPKTQRYGAVGHVISNSSTGEPLDVDDGRIVKAYISGLRAGLKGRPGEKQGIFNDEKDVIGTITKNTEFGIYGDIYSRATQKKEAIPVAWASQIKEGPAKILTVLSGEEVEEFAIRIDRVNRQLSPNGRGLEITITDTRLLQRTGGIIQGMSGSPIIQDGRLVGAVTHVFMNDPTKGYGVLAEWMIYEAGILQERSEVTREFELAEAC